MSCSHRKEGDWRGNKNVACNEDLSTTSRCDDTEADLNFLLKLISEDFKGRETRYGLLSR